MTISSPLLASPPCAKLQLRRLEGELATALAELREYRSLTTHLLASVKLARYHASHDDLTGLPNRQGFRSRLEEVIGHPSAAGAPSTLLYLDLDGFKQLNDRHGHDVGDQLLKAVAFRLSHAMRDQDMVSRVGGDEFACLLTAMASLDQIDALVLNLLAAVEAPMTLNGGQYQCRLSIGIAIAPGAGISVHALMKRADQAMYCAKRDRSGHAFFDSPGVAR